MIFSTEFQGVKPAPQWPWSNLKVTAGQKDESGRRVFLPSSCPVDFWKLCIIAEYIEITMNINYTFNIHLFFPSQGKYNLTDKTHTRKCSWVALCSLFIFNFFSFFFSFYKLSSSSERQYLWAIFKTVLFVDWLIPSVYTSCNWLCYLLWAMKLARGQVLTEKERVLDVQFDSSVNLLEASSINLQTWRG